jgi:hypothetical protein
MDDGRVRASGAAAEIADRYMEEVNVRALANQSTPLQSQRAGTGEIRYTTIEVVDRDGRPSAQISEGGPLVVRAAYEATRPVDSPVFQVAIVDVDTGITVATATSAPASAPAGLERSGMVDCIFDSLPLRPRHYVLRMTITDAHQLVAYDVVTAGPRFVVGGAGQSGDDGDGVVSLPHRFHHHVRVLS